MNTEGRTINRLFVLLDAAKPETELQLPWAMHFARTWNSPVTLLHLVDPARVDVPIEYAEAAADDYLSLAASGPLIAGQAVEKEVRVGLAHEEWQAIAGESPEATLMIFAAERSGATPAFISGMMEDVIRVLASPVVVIPRSAGAPTEIERVIVGTDRSSFSESVLRIAAQLAPASGVSVIETEVLERGSRPDHELLRMQPTMTALKVVMRGQAGPAILSVARHRDAQLIVVGTHGRGGIIGVGSTAEWLARYRIGQWSSCRSVGWSRNPPADSRCLKQRNQ